MITGTSPVYAQIADALRNRVAAWDEAGWPSVRVIAGEFNVSVVTASRALQALKEHAAATKAPGIAEEHWAVCLHVSPGPYHHAAYQVTASGFRELARQARCRVDLETVRLDDEPTDQVLRDRVRAAAASGANGLFLLPSRVSEESARRDERLLAVAATEKLRVVLIERNLRGDSRPLTHDLICFHDFDGGLTLAQHQLERGRKRVAFVAGSPTSSLTERLGGYLAAVCSAGFSPIIALEPSGVAPREAYTAIVDHLVAAHADGVIGYHDHVAIGVLMELLRRGIRVPADVAVAGFYNMPIGESFSIGMTTYDFPAATVARRAVDLMRWRLANPDAPPMKHVVPGKLIVRDSTDPACL